MSPRPTRSRSATFWTIRLVVVIANGPILGYLQWRYPPADPLLSYLCWMSWATWLSSELPSGKD